MGFTKKEVTVHCFHWILNGLSLFSGSEVHGFMIISWSRAKNFATIWFFVHTNLKLSHSLPSIITWNETKNNLIRKFLDQYMCGECLICNEYAIIYYCSFAFLFHFIVFNVVRPFRIECDIEKNEMFWN